MGNTIIAFLCFGLFAFVPLGLGPKPFWLTGMFQLAFMVVYLTGTAFRGLWLMAAVLLSDLVARAFISDPHLIFYVPSYAVGLACYAVVIHTLCPRCKTHLITTWSALTGIGHRPYCPSCGRSHAGVKPFQHLTHPEDWDGQYHDEGGGRQTESAKRDTEHARSNWQKKKARNN